MQERRQHGVIGAQVHLLHIPWFDVVLMDQAQHFTHGWMRQRSGRMRLYGNAGRCERPGFGKASNDRVGIETAACGLKETERRLQNVVGGRPSERGKVDGYSPIFSGVSRLERFRHGTEIISEAPAFSGDNTKRVLCLQHIQPSQLRASRGAPERSTRAGGMKTLVVVAWRDEIGR